MFRSWEDPKVKCVHTGVLSARVQLRSWLPAWLPLFLISYCLASVCGPLKLCCCYAASGEYAQIPILQVQTVQGILWECTPATRCKGGAPLAQPQRFAPYARPAQTVPGLVQSGLPLGYGAVGMGGFAGAGGLGTMGLAALPTLGMGSDDVVCGLHGKKRKVSFMEELSPGQYRCRSDSVCKVCALTHSPYVVTPEGLSCRCTRLPLC